MRFFFSLQGYQQLPAAAVHSWKNSLCYTVPVFFAHYRTDSTDSHSDFFYISFKFTNCLNFWEAKIWICPSLSLWRLLEHFLWVSLHFPSNMFSSSMLFWSMHSGFILENFFLYLHLRHKYIHFLPVFFILNIYSFIYSIQCYFISLIFSKPYTVFGSYSGLGYIWYYFTRPISRVCDELTL